jgi:hypothetical protein
MSAGRLGCSIDARPIEQRIGFDGARRKPRLMEEGGSMPEFEKLDAKRAAELFDKPVRDESAAEVRARIRAQYKAYLTGLAPGEGGELTPEEGETKEKVRYQLEQAAKELGLKLTFKRRKDNKVIFRVVAP